MMSLKQFISSIRWFTAYLSCVSMCISSLALAKEAENNNLARIQAFVKETKLEQRQTWAEFFEKTKASYPQEVAIKIKEFVDLNPELLLPEVKLKTVQNSDGQQTPVIEVFDHGKTHTIQIVGEEEKWAKIDGIILRKSDVENPANGLIRLQTSNIFFRYEADAFFAKHNISEDSKFLSLRADLSRFRGFPRITPQLWTALTKSQRKGFIKQIALVWSKASTVNNLKSSRKNKKTSLLENYIRQFLLAEAIADDASGPSYDQTKAKTLSDLEQFLSSDPAILESFKSGVWTADLDRQLVQFEVAAESEASQALNTCISKVSGPNDSGTVMDNAEVQQAACEQFHQSMLINERFIAPFREKSCRSPAHYIGQYSDNDSAAAKYEKDKVNRAEIHPDLDFLCACDESGSKKVKFNEACESVQPAVTASDYQTPAITETPADHPYAPKKKSSSNIWPLAIGGAALGYVAALLFFKGGKKKAAETSTASAPTTTPTCPANKVGTPPNCTCGACSPPQQVFNFVTCQCTNLPGSIICPNNEAAPNGDVSKCPRCSDGTYKTTDACPVATPASSGDKNVVPVTQ